MPPRRRRPESLAQLVTDGSLETVEPDPDAARNELEMARRHIDSVAALTTHTCAVTAIAPQAASEST